MIDRWRSFDIIFFFQNPEDPTTFPPPISDGQSSVTYTNPTGQNGPGWYGGMPEL